jgi:hypothetical protein
MSAAAISTASPELAAMAALAAQQQNQAGLAAVQAAVEQDTGGGAGPMVSSSVQAPGSLEVFA